MEPNIIALSFIRHIHISLCSMSYRLWDCTEKHVSNNALTMTEDSIACRLKEN